MSAVVVTLAVVVAVVTAIGIHEVQRRLETRDYYRHVGD